VAVLAGVKQLTPRSGNECTLIGCVEAVLRYHGEAHDYVDLMGLSAAAFRIRVAYSAVESIAGGRVHPGISVDAQVGPHVQALSGATGYTFARDGHFINDEGERAVGSRIEAEIDAGRPVVAMNLCNDSCWGVVTGYDPEVPVGGPGDSDYRPGRLLCRTYQDAPGSGYERAPHFPWDLYFVSKPVEPLPQHEAVRASIRAAADLLTTPRARVNIEGGWLYHWQPEYANGIAAYDAWIREIQDEHGIRRLPPDQYLMYWQAHAWMYDQLHDARRAAAAYVSRAARLLGAQAVEPLEHASRAYDEMVRLLTEGWSCFPYWSEEYVEPGTGWRLRPNQEELLGRRVPARSSEWTSDMRREGIELLGAVKEKERHALSLLSKVA